jgi:cytochrome c-type biogenesis protein CcmH
MSRRPAAWIGLALLAVAAALAAVALRGPGPARTTADQVHDIAAGLRCPVCNDLSVADSPAPLARQMRETIAGDLRAGKRPDQIRAEFVAAYGESILLSPPHRGVGLVAWLAPALLLAAGLAVALAAVRRWRHRPAAGGAAPGAPDGAAAADGAGAARRGPEGGAAAGRSPRPLPVAQRRLLERALAQLDEEERR